DAKGAGIRTARSLDAGRVSVQLRISPPAACRVRRDGLLAKQEEFYKLLGDDYEKANRQAYVECGRDYANFKCMCPRAQAIVICLAGKQLGNPAEIPSWLQQQHCPNAPPPTRANGLTSYQQLLVNVTSKPCKAVLRDYFAGLNYPVHASD